MAEYLIQDTTLDAIADAINAKTGGSSAMTPAQMVTEIGSIPSGGGGGLQLLASGSYTNASTTTAVTIPVSYSGTAKMVLVTKDEVDADLGEMIAWWYLVNYEPSRAFNIFGVINSITRYKTATGNPTTLFSNSSTTLTSTTIRVAQYGPSYPVQSGDYNWYIWG